MERYIPANSNQTFIYPSGILTLVFPCHSVIFPDRAVHVLGWIGRVGRPGPNLTNRPKRTWSPIQSFKRLWSLSGSKRIRGHTPLWAELAGLQPGSPIQSTNAQVPHQILKP